MNADDHASRPRRHRLAIAIAFAYGVVSGHAWSQEPPSPVVPQVAPKALQPTNPPLAPSPSGDAAKVKTLRVVPDATPPAEPDYYSPPTVIRMFPFEMPRQFPAAVRAVRRLVAAKVRPDIFRRRSGGGFSFLKSTESEGRDFLIGVVCLARDDCRRQIAFLVARGGGHARALLVEGSRKTYRGAPSAAERELLDNAALENSR